MSGLEVGDRILVEGNGGKIQFCGRIEGDKTNGKTEWIGIEWDDPSRGKHNGNAYGKQYFQTEYPTSGSFVKRDTLLSSLTKSTDFVSAVLTKYCSGEDDISENTREYITSTSNKDIPVDVVGMKKLLGKLKVHQRSELGLSMLGISEAGDESVIDELCPNVSSLDISGNLFSNLEDVSRIISHLSKLSFLQLSFNRFSSLCSLDVPSLKILVLNYTNIKWNEFLGIFVEGSNLKEIHLCYNGLKDVTETGKVFQSIEVVNLEGNFLTEFPVALAKVVPSLRSLNISKNNISRISEVRNGSHDFSELENLLFPNNCVAEVDSVDALNSFSKIREVRANGNPVFSSMSSMQVRQLVIARLPTLTVYNGADVMLKERRDTEKYYVKQHLSEKDSDPHVRRLAEKHGLDVNQMSKAYQSLSSSKSHMISVSIISQAIDTMEKPPVEKKLPISMKVQQLKKFVKILFGLEPEKQVLYFRSDSSEPFPMKMEDEWREIGHYINFDSGEIVMQELDSDGTDSEEREADAFMEKVEQQERTAMMLMGTARDQRTREKEAAMTSAQHKKEL